MGASRPEKALERANGNLTCVKLVLQCMLGLETLQYDILTV